MSWRVGLLIPSSNTVMEVDFYRNLAHDTTVHTGRMYMVDTTVAGEERMLDEFTMPAAGAVGTALPHVVVFGCTSAGALRGKQYDQELCGRIAGVTNAAPVSVIASVNKALRDTRATRVAVITPYADELNLRIKASVEAEGIEVTAMHGMGITNNFDIASVSPDEIVDFVRSRLGARVPGEALFLSCTNFHAMNALSALKIIYDVPMVTSNLAALQAVKEQIAGLRQSELELSESATR
ncbi:MAG TPA: Asp/Glu racemase [Chloroflexota bacterium]|jgi:maleate isomerase